jgi:large conductance mechanosensitive channel
MKQLLEEFKAFAIKGNVVDLAVAVVIGAAFGKIVTSLVENIITPTISIFMGGVDFTGHAFTIGTASIKYGVFIQSVVDFTIVAFVIFLAIKVLTRLKKEETTVVADTPAEPSDEVKLLTEIRDLLNRKE